MTTSARILVTAATGFLGRVIVDHLAGQGRAVVATGRRARPEDLDPSVGWVVWDCHGTPPASLDAEIVVDCASAIPTFVKRADEMLETNVRLAAAATDVASRNRASLLICCSSMAVYGRPEVDEITDTTPTIPDQVYGLSKLAAEAIWGESVDRGEVGGQISMRLPAVLGRGSRHNFPSGFAEKLAAGAPVQVFNPDGLYNTCVHGADIAAFVGHLIDHPPTGRHAGTIAADQPMPMLRAVEAIAEGMGCRLDPEIKPATMRATTVATGVMRTLGFTPSSVRDTLLRFGQDRAP
jgi:UDP-glucose 4-epimerase